MENTEEKKKMEEQQEREGQQEQGVDDGLEGHLISEQLRDEHEQEEHRRDIEDPHRISAYGAYDIVPDGCEGPFRADDDVEVHDRVRDYEYGKSVGKPGDDDIEER